MSRYEFAKGLVEGRRVLDIGCGCGYGTYHLASGGALVTVGIDRSVEAVEYSLRNYRHPRLSFAVMDAARLSLKGRFDVVTCFELIEHVEDAHDLLEGVRRVMDETGVFMVSTPNKATYVAGGEGGKNPFHTREYSKDEFADLLRGVFASVRILGQHWVDGMALGPHTALSGCAETYAGLLPRDKVPAPAAGGGTKPASDTDSEPPYFIGLCAKRDILDEVIGNLRPLAFYGRSVRYDTLKQATKQLEQEFDRRGEWAQSLDGELKARDKMIRDLQLDLEERGEWAQRLNAELRQSGGLVERLADENRRLRESLSDRRPSGGSKVAG